MTTNGNWTKTANGARGKAPGGAPVFVCGTALCRAQARRSRRALRWKQDAVCRETASAAADSERTDAEGVPSAGTGSSGSSVTRTILFTSRIQTQPLTRKETLNTNQKKKGTKKQNAVTIRKNLETLA
jgi:hypothetical protein